MRRLSKNVPGQPGVPMLRPGSNSGKQGVRRLIKRDPARGITMPEADAITQTSGAGLANATARRLVKAPFSAFGAGVKTISAAGSRIRTR